MSRDAHGMPPEYDPERDVVLDARSLRGIAHPLRPKLLGMLRRDGPSTATKLAEQLGLSSGITSYHLRQLAAYGFIAEDTGRGHGRERWWRAAHRSTRFDQAAIRATGAAEGADEEELDALSDEYLQSVADIYASKVREWLGSASRLPAKWRDTGTLSDILLRLTPEETERLQSEIDELLSRYRRDAVADTTDVPRDARRVAVQWQVFPWANRD
ncbi:MAG: helix-turn-helix domain-containing protein [Streptosporangiales bacterium]